MKDLFWSAGAELAKHLDRVRECLTYSELIIIERLLNIEEADLDSPRADRLREELERRAEGYKGQRCILR